MTTLPRHRPLLTALCVAWLAWPGGAALAQNKPAAGSAGPGHIYTCVDAQGRRLTSDRPIAACIDREQRELSSSGTVKRVIPPTPTADELAVLEAKRKAEAEREARINEERRKERALLSRYPSEEAHQRERLKALEQVEAVQAAIQKRGEELAKQRKTIDDEMGFYAKDPSKAPAWLRHKLKENQTQAQAQAQALLQQAGERQRVSDRFDAELVQLRKLWAEAAQAGGAPAR
jgi:hypothetical protein